MVHTDLADGARHIVASHRVVHARRVTDEPASIDGRSTLGRAMATDPRPVDVREVLANTDFFADARRDTLDGIAAHAETRQLVRGDVLFQEGDPPDACTS